MTLEILANKYRAKGTETPEETVNEEGRNMGNSFPIFIHFYFGLLTSLQLCYERLLFFVVLEDGMVFVFCISTGSGGWALEAARCVSVVSVALKST